MKRSSLGNKAISILLTFTLCFWAVPAHAFAEPMQGGRAKQAQEAVDEQPAANDQGTATSQAGQAESPDANGGKQVYDLGGSSGQDANGAAAASDDPSDADSEEAASAALESDKAAAQAEAQARAEAEAAAEAEALANDPDARAEGASIHKMDDLLTVSLFGEAAHDEQKAVDAVLETAADETDVDISRTQADELVSDLFDAVETSNAEVLKEEQEAAAALPVLAGDEPEAAADATGEAASQEEAGASPVGSIADGFTAVLDGISNAFAPQQAFAEDPAVAPTSVLDLTYPRKGDGSDIESITIKWLPTGAQTTQDASYDIQVANPAYDPNQPEGPENPKSVAATRTETGALLYMQPSSDADMRVKFQLDYAVSGEHSYAPGDVTITIPAYIFHQRTANNEGTEAHSKNPADYGYFLSPMLEAPNRRTDFNWQLVEDEQGNLNYVFTNTKRMAAASRGFIQFSISELTPHSVIDMSITDNLQATMQVTTHRDNTLALHSNVLTAQVNTAQAIRSATKRVATDSPYLVTASELENMLTAANQQIPDDIKAKYPNESHYVIVNWYMYGYHSGNQPYTLEGIDTRTDVWDHDADYGAAVDSKGKPTNFHDGFLVGGERSADIASDESKADIYIGNNQQAADGEANSVGTDARDLNVIQKGWYGNGTTPYSNVRGVFPLSQFQENTDYYFSNRVDYRLTPIDEVDNPTYQSASARVRFNYSAPQWIEPYGHFNVFKWGNDNDYGYNGIDGYDKSSRYRPELTTHYLSGGYAYDRDDIPTPGKQHLQGYYGQYFKGLNQLQGTNTTDPQDIIIGYTMKSEGWLLPWIWGGSLSEEPPATMVEDNYGRRPVTMITEDTGLWVGAQRRDNASFELKVHDDYEFVALDFCKPEIGKIKAINVNPDGSFAAMYAEDGTFEYQPDTDDSKIPPITLELQMNGSEEWVPYAVEDWSSGQCEVTVAEGAPDGTTLEFVDGSSTTLKLPEGVDNFRTRVTSGNAYIWYYVRPIVQVKSTEKWQEAIEAAFVDSNNPMIPVWNGVEMWAYEYNGDLGPMPESGVRQIPMVAEGDPELGDLIVDISKEGYDKLYGYTTDIAAVPYKEAKFNETRDVDYETRTLTLHYKARVEERSVIAEKDIYQEALDDGILIPETSCVWYDLLPPGVTPLTGTVRLPRKGDTVKNVRTYQNYKNSGRTLLVVEADLTPTPETYKDGDVTYYMDAPKIEFDASYTFEGIFDYGQDLHNVIVFESGNDQLGTIKDYTGEANNPDGTNNVATADAWSSDADEAALEKSTLSGDWLADRTTNSFLYAGADTTVDVLSDAMTSIHKEVSVNNDGWYSQGLYYLDQDFDYSKPYDENVYEGIENRDVYEGGQYSYRIRMMSNSDTVTKDMVIYDSLENFTAGHGNDGWDHVLVRQYESVAAFQNATDKTAEEYDYVVLAADGTERITHQVEDPSDEVWSIKRAPHWRGTLRNVDVSHLILMGCAPVVYYSVADKLQMQIGEGTEGHINPDIKLDDHIGDVWVRADEYTGSLADVHAIAIDARQASTDVNEDGVVDEQDEFTLQPLETAVVYFNMTAPTGENAAPHIEANAHAYNNIYLDCLSIDSDTGISSGENFIRNDYTKVGLLENTIEARKVWDDDGNRDGIRPTSATLTLYRNGQVYDPTGIPGFENFQNPAVVTADDADESGAWVHLFEHLPYADDQGNVIRWTVAEEDANVPEGYEASVTSYDEGHTYVVTNTHEPEKTRITGEKQWVVPREGFTDMEYAAVQAAERISRPASIRVNLYADGKFDRELRVSPDANGNWSYAFENLLKNKRVVNEQTQQEETVPIVYTVDETAVPNGSLDSYITAIEENGEGGYTIVNTYHPRGNFELSKTTQGATAASAGQAFTFTLEFMRQTGTYSAEDAAAYNEENGFEPGSADYVKEGDFIYEPDTGTYEYVIVNTETQEEVGSGTVESNGTVQLKDKQTVRVRELPMGVRVVATETVPAGWTATNGETQTAVIKPNTTVSVTASNSYKTEGSLSLSAAKSLTGRPSMQNNQFRFELYSENLSIAVPDGQERTVGLTKRGDDWVIDINDPCNILFRTAASNASGFAPFGVINYSNGDTGKTFRYYMSEVDRGRSGYTYDKAIYRVEVTPVDNGDGTMTATPVYSKAQITETVNEQTGDPVPQITWIPCEDDPATDVDESVPSFANQYNAEGKTTLRAWKQLEGGKIADYDGAFTFELLDGSDGASLGTATNNARGEAMFETITYTQADLVDDQGNPTFVKTPDGTLVPGKEFTYAVREIAGSDPDITYSDDVFGYTVTVYDNGDGTLSCIQGTGTTAPIYNGASCPHCEGFGYKLSRINLDVELPTFQDLIDWLGAFEGMSNTLPGKDSMSINRMYAGFSGMYAAGTGRVVPREVFESAEFQASALMDDTNSVSFDASASNIASQVRSVLNEKYGMYYNSYKDTAMRYFAENQANVGPVGVMRVLDGEGPDYYGVSVMWNEAGRGASAIVEPCKQCMGYGQGIGSYVVEADGSAPLPIFTNTLKPGALEVAKNVENPSEAPDTLFKFRLELENPDGTPVDAALENVEFYQSEAYAKYDAASQTLTFYRDKPGLHRDGEKVFSDLPDGKSPFKKTEGDITYYTGVETFKWGEDVNHYPAWCGIDSEGRWAASPIKRVLVADRIAPTGCGWFFAGLDNCTSFGLEKLDTSNCTLFYSMFEHCSSVETLDLSGFDTSQGTWFNWMFSNCPSLSTVYASQRLAVPAEALAESNEMFQAVPLLTGGAGTTFSQMGEISVGGQYARIDGGPDSPGFFTAKPSPSAGTQSAVAGTMGARPTGAAPMAAPVAPPENAGVDSSQPAIQLPNPLDLFAPEKAYADEADDAGVSQWENWGTWEWGIDGNGTLWIRPTGGEAEATVTDIGKTAHSKVPWYNQLGDIQAIDVPEGKTIHLAGSLMSGLFANLRNLTYIDLTNFETSQVQDMSYWFHEDAKLATIDGLSGIDTSNVTDMSGMFSGCSALSELDVSSFNTANVTDMSNMFSGCRSLTKLDVSPFSTTKATDIGGMFFGCTSLTSLTLTGFDTSHVTNMWSTFEGCSAITSLDLSEIDTSNVAVLYDAFRDCSSLVDLNLSGFETGSLTTMPNMCKGCTSLVTVDLSGMNTSNVTSMWCLFQDCSALETVYASSSFVVRADCLDNAYGMFSNCNLLTGGNGTSFASKQVSDATYAKVDKPGQEGYFTELPFYIEYHANNGTGDFVRKACSPSSSTPIDGNMFVGIDTFEYWTLSPNGSGDIYTPRDLIAANTYSAGEVLKLYAQWEPFVPTIMGNNGVYEWSMPGNYTMHMPDLPAGTTYRVYEETPDGWVLVSQGNTSGTIPANGTAEASFTNRYQPSATSATLNARKTLDGVAADAGAFRFVLQEVDDQGSPVAGGVSQTKANASGGGITFDPIVYERAGTFYYTISEVVPAEDDAAYDPTIAYDTHVQNVTVTVTDDGNGNLSASTAYDGLELGELPTFANETHPGSLRLTKQVEGTAATDKEFTFEIEFRDEKGRLAEDQIEYYVLGSKSDSGSNASSGNGLNAFAQAPAAVSQGIGDFVEAAGGAVENGFDFLLGVEKAYAAERDVWYDYTEDGSSFKWMIKKPGGYSTEWYNEIVFAPRDGETDIIIDAAAETGPSAPWREGINASYGVPRVTFQGDGTVYIRNYGGVGLFRSLHELDEIHGLERFDTSQAKSLREMFYWCEKLTSLDLSNWDVSNVEDMSHMFSCCDTLSSLNVSGWQTGSCKDMTRMFAQCYRNLASIDVSGFDMSNVEDMEGMFLSCAQIESLDLSNWDLSNARDMARMFDGCYKLQSIDLSNPKTSQCTSFEDIFQDCWALSNLNISGLDMSSATTVAGMFSGCRSLESVDLTEVIPPAGAADAEEMFSNCNTLKEINLDSFTQIGKTQSMFAGCPNLSTVYTTVDLGATSAGSADSRWMFRYSPKLTGALGTNVADETDAYGNTVDGRFAYIDRPGQKGFYTGLASYIDYYANDGTDNHVLSDGFVASQDSIAATPSSFGAAFMRPGMVIDYWSTEPDGTGDTYLPGQIVPGGTVERGSVAKLYAHWRAPVDDVAYYVSHWQQNTTLDGYDLAETESFRGNEPDEVTPAVKDYAGFASPNEQTIQIVSESTLHYYYDRARFELVFDANGGEGQMGSMSFIGGISQQLLPLGFTNGQKQFLEWNTEADGSGFAYSDRQSVRDLGPDGQTVTLYAIWADEPTVVTPTSGKITVTLKAGETLVVPSLPAGTTYTITETSLPDGYVLTDMVNESGEIVSLEAAYASAKNRYEAAGGINLEAHKSMSNGPLEAAQFSFELLDAEGNVLSTASNDSDGNVKFDMLEFTTDDMVDDQGNYVSQKDFTYTVREVADESSPDYDESVVYDESEHSITVTVTDTGGGVLEAVADYDVSDSDDREKPEFVNSYKTLELELSKAVENATAATKDAAFEFEVKLLGADGEELEGSFPVLIKHEGYSYSDTRETVVRTSHTGNVDSEGNRIGTYENSSRYADAVTIEGAKQLNVDLRYGTEDNYDFVYVWEGSHPDYSSEPKWYASSSLSGELSGGDSSGSKTESYAIGGDSVTFGFHSDGSQNDYYGYYAVITAETGELVETGATHTSIESGGTLALKDGESLTIGNLPYGCTYEITERDKPGFALVSAEGATGTLGEGNLAPQAAFTNSYAAYGEVPISVGKNLTGWDLDEGQFEFELRDSFGEVLQRTTNTAAGRVAFTPLPFTQEDAGNTYTYQIVEVEAGDPGYTYETDPIDVSVKVIDNGNGTLSFDVKYGDEAEAAFDNRYESSGTATVQATKALSGRAQALQENEFSFQLLDANNAQAGAAGNAANGSVAIDVVYTQDDMADAETVVENGVKLRRKTFEYTLKEVLPTDQDTTVEGVQKDGVTYDPAEYTVKVTVTDRGDGKLTTSVAYGDGDGNALDTGALPAFENEYTAGPVSLELKAKKALTGRDFETDETFTFKLASSDAATPMPDGAQANTAPLAGSHVSKSVGNADPVGFGSITYTMDDLVGGTVEADGSCTKNFYYSINEVVPEDADKAPGLTYDSDTHSVVVTLTDDGKGNLTATAVYDSSTAEEATLTNAYEPTPTSFTVHAQKKLNGEVLSPSTAAATSAEFAFDLYDANDAFVASSTTAMSKDTNPASLSLQSVVTFDRAGTYTYKLRERIPDGAKSADGTLEYKHDGDGATTLEQRDATTWTKDGITYQSAPVTVTVAVTDVANGAHTGQLAATVSYDSSATVGEGAAAYEAAELSNTYAAEGQAQVKVSKSFTGRTGEAWQGDEFTIQLLDADGNVAGSVVAEDGTTVYDLAAIDYALESLDGAASRTFAYTIHEFVAGAGGADANAGGGKTVDGITYAADKPLWVKVTDQGNGTLKCEYSTTSATEGFASALATQTVANTYAIDDQKSIRLSATKQVLDSDGNAMADWGDFAEKAFVFQLSGSGMASAETKQVAKDEPTASFSELTFNAPGTYTYTVRELSPAGTVMEQQVVDGGLVYDKAVHTVVVTIEDAGNGKLADPVVTVDGTRVSDPAAIPSIVFSNRQEGTDSVQLGAVKTLAGRNLVANEFSFQLYELAAAGSGDELPAGAEPVGAAVTNAANGAISFPQITYTLEDLRKADGTYETSKTFYYAAKETSTNGNGVAVDAGIKYYEVVVSNTGDHTVAVESIAPAAENLPVFANVYTSSGTAQLHVNKLLTGRSWKSGESFTFQLKNAGGQVLGEKVATSAADMQFDQISFSQEDMKVEGSYVAERVIPYTIHEVVPDGSEGNGISYAADKTVYVKLVDNQQGQIAATYSLSENGPFTATLAQADARMANSYEILRDTSATLQATKTIHDKSGSVDEDWKVGEGDDARDWSATTFDFVLLSSDDATPMPAGATQRTDNEGKGKWAYNATGATAASKTASFGAIAYTVADMDGLAEKTFTYDIREVKAAADRTAGEPSFVNGLYIADHLVYSTTAHSVSVKVVDDGNGGLQVESVTYGNSSTTPSTFNNIEQGDCEIVLGGKKSLTGRPLEEGLFSFELFQMESAADNDFTDEKRIDSGTMAADGTVKKVLEYNFADLDGATSRTFHYAGREVVPGDVDSDSKKDGVTYSRAVHRFEVIIAKDGNTGVKVDGVKIDGTPVGLADGQLPVGAFPVHSNTYESTGQPELSVSKAFTGRDWRPGETFTIQLKEGANVLDSIQVGEDDEAVSFANLPTYTQDSFAAGDWSGNTATKVFAYTLHEIAGTPDNDANASGAGCTLDGITYAADKTVYVKATDNGNGSVTCTYSTDGTNYANTLGALEFANSYQITGQVTAQLSATKAMFASDGAAMPDTWVTDDNDFSARTFNFVLAASNAASKATMPALLAGSETKTAAAGAETVRFSQLTFTEPGTYSYTINEVRPGDATLAHPVHEGITYDTATYDVSVTVGDDGKGGLTQPVVVITKRGEMSATDAAVFSNYEVGSDSVAFGAKKTVEGMNLGSDYTFSLYRADSSFAKQGNALQTKGNNGTTGAIGFDPISYTWQDIADHAGTAPHRQTFYYVIEEDAGTNDAITYASNQIKIAVDVEETSTVSHSVEVKKVTVNDTPYQGAAIESIPWDSYTFNNKYASSGTAQIKAKKTLSGRDWKPGDSFEFVLDGPKVGQDDATRTVVDGSEVAFGTLSFTQDDMIDPDTGAYLSEREFVYTVSETAGSLGGVTYAADQTVKVKLTDNGAGTITPSYTYGQATTTVPPVVDMVNTYAYSGNATATLGATKQLVGRAGQAGDTFTFSLAAGTATYADGSTPGTSPMPAASGQTASVDMSAATDGETSDVVQFGQISFDKPGSYNYVITESIPADAKNAEGQLFGTAGAQGPWKKNGVTYDESRRTATVVVVDNLDGGLNVESVTYAGGAEGGTLPEAFVNRYSEDAVSVEFEGQKTMIGRELVGGKYSFELYSSRGPEADWALGDLVQRLSVGQAAASPHGAVGQMATHAIRYTESGTWHYVVVELGADGRPGSGGVKDGVSYDASQSRITVSVTDVDPQTGLRDGTLRANVAYDNNTEGAAENDKVLTDKVALTNIYEAEGTTDIKLSKTLSGRDWRAGEDKFDFTLQAVGEHAADTPMPAGTEKGAVATCTATASGATVDMGTITYSVADLGGASSRAFTYRLTENDTAIGGVAKDASEYLIVVTVTDSGSGTLDVSKSVTKDGNPVDAGVDVLPFENSYTTNEVQATLKARKMLVGRTWDNGETFKFTLGAASDATPLPDAADCVREASEGVPDVEFGQITYTLADMEGATLGSDGKTRTKQFFYTIAEDNGGSTVAGTAYDGNKQARVTVVDDGEGVLSVAGVEYSADGQAWAAAPAGVVFSNTYTASEAQVVLEGVKTFNGAIGKDQFSFELYEADEGFNVAAEAEPIQTVAAAEGSGAFSFSEITFSEAGAYHYVIREVVPANTAGVTYDTHDCQVTVEVVDVADGKHTGTLTAGATYSDGERASFANSYQAQGSAVLGGNKVLVGRDLAEGEFEFALFDAEGAELGRATNRADGAFDFAPIAYTFDDAGKTFTYTIREIVPDDAVEGRVAGADGSVLAYDAHEETVTVTVEDRGDGALEVVSVVDASGVAFTNDYTPPAPEVRVPLSATKTLEGGNLEAGQFSFELMATSVVEGDPLVGSLGASNDADGKVDFGELVYTMPGAYEYLVAERATDPTIQYDERVHTVRVTVEQAGAALAAKVEHAVDGGAYEEGVPEFVNTADGHPNAVTVKSPLSLDVAKTVDGRKPGEAEFEFRLESLAEGAPGAFPRTAKNDPDGKVDFGRFEFSDGDVGKTYRFRIAEVDDERAGYIYDAAAYEVSMRVFRNEEGGISVYMWCEKDGKEAKASEPIAFDNKTTTTPPPPGGDEPEKPGNPTTPPGTPRAGAPPATTSGGAAPTARGSMAGTGDALSAQALAGLALAAAGALALAAWARRRKDDADEA